MKIHKNLEGFPGSPTEDTQGKEVCHGLLAANGGCL